MDKNMPDPLNVGDIRYGFFLQRRRDGRFGRAYRVTRVELQYANGPLYWVHDVAFGPSSIGQYAHHSELLTDDEIQAILAGEAAVALAMQ